MIRSIVYVFPCLVNALNGGLYLYTALYLSQNGYSGFITGCSIAVWALAYAIVSAVSAKYLSLKNCVPRIMAAAALMGLAFVGFLLFRDVYLIFALTILGGVGSALYCSAFQFFMKTLESDEGGGQGLVRPTALYTMSWSIGMAAGPFFYGALSQNVCFIVCIALALIVIVGIYLVWRNADRIRAINQQHLKHDDGEKEIDYLQYPNCVWLGWLTGGVGTLAVWAVRAMEPVRATALHFPENHTSYALALLSAVQALAAFGLLWGKTWMYKGSRTVLIGLCGVAGLLCFAFGNTIVWFYAAAVFYGIFSGCIYFYFVFFSLAQKNSAKAISINESIVGVVGVLGPVLCGCLSDFDTSYPFLLCAILVFFVLGYHSIRVGQLMKKAGMQ